MMETGTGSQLPIPNGQILPQLIMEAKAASGLDIHHLNEDSDDRRVKDMLENYTSHVFQQQKQKSMAMSQQFRQFIPSAPAPSLPPTSHSHPCLFMIDETKRHGRASDEIRQSPHPTMVEQTKNDFYDPPSYSNTPVFYQESSQNITPPNTAVVKMSDLAALKSENEVLRKKAESLEQKVGKLRQLEQAYDRIEKEFEQVLNQRDQQEKIEKLAMAKMEQHIQRLTADNSILLQRLETLSNLNSQPELPPQPSSDNMQLAQLTMLLNEYVAQNKELQNSNDRQKIELEAQTVTLNEQTNHIVMLEKALTNAQERLAVKDRQLMDNNLIVERCQHLQKLLQESIEDKQRRQEEFIKEKAQLEMEIAMAKVQKDSPSPRKSRNSPEPDEKIKKMMTSKDERISQLESTILQLQRKFGDDKHKNELFLKAEVENLNSCYRKVELEKLEKDRRIQELLNENRKLHEQLVEERHLMDRRFSVLEEDVRKLSVGRATNARLLNNSPPSLASTRQYQISGFTPMTTAMSVSSLQQFDKDPIFTRQRNYFGDPNGKMEELRRNIAERRQQPRSLSRPRMPGSAPVPQREETVTNNNGHYRASSGPSSVIHSTKLPQYENQAEMERQISEYMASLPAATRRRFAAATGLDEKDFVPPQSYQVAHNVTPSLPEGTKLPLSRQISKGSSASSSSKRQITPMTPSDPSVSKEKDLSSIRIHLIEPSTDAKIESDDSEELRSRSGSSGSQTPSEPEEPQTPASGVSAASFSNNLVRNPPPMYSFDVQTPQSVTQIHTTTVVEVNKDQLGGHRHLRKQPRSLNHQSNSAGSDPTSNN